VVSRDRLYSSAYCDHSVQGIQRNGFYQCAKAELPGNRIDNPFAAMMGQPYRSNPLSNKKMQLLLDSPLGVGIPLEHCTAVATFLQSVPRNCFSS
jgi:hypothetical protein